MKKVLLIFALILVMTVSAFAFASCVENSNSGNGDANNGSENNGNENEYKTETLQVELISLTSPIKAGKSATIEILAEPNTK